MNLQLMRSIWNSARTGLAAIGALTTISYIVRVVIVFRETDRTRKLTEQIGDVWHGSTS